MMTAVSNEGYTLHCPLRLANTMSLTWQDTNELVPLSDVHSAFTTKPVKG